MFGLMLCGGHLAYADSQQVSEVTIDDITVEAKEETEKNAVPKEQLESGRFVNVGEVLTEIAGVSAVRRGASATEPVIRGLGWERGLFAVTNAAVSSSPNWAQG